MGNVKDITRFDCSYCGKPIPDKELERLVKIRVEEGKLQIICPRCQQEEIHEQEVAERRQNLVLFTYFKG